MNVQRTPGAGAAGPPALLPSLWLSLFRWAAVCLLALSPATAWACACGCGVFQVGTGTMMPTASGGRVWLEWDFLDQNKNWSGTSSAPAADNEDKGIRTDFLTAGVQYMFNRKWGVEAELPYWFRNFETTTDDPNPGDTGSFSHSDIGDVRIRGIYSGFSDDMSTGVTFGLKLASGNFTYPNFDRDTAIGSGSTDLLLGAYHMGDIGDPTQPGHIPLKWFANAQWERAFMIQDSYRPGDETDFAVGSYYDGIRVGKGGRVSPLLQVVGSVRARDDGGNSDRPNSGYRRLLIAPGVEYAVRQVRLYGDVEVPVYQKINGDQLISPVSLKLMAAWLF
jgi:hypothetical protein